MLFRSADAELVQRHPQLVVEVLSDSTAAFDRGPKFEAYRCLESLTAYLLVEQDRAHIDLFLRNADGLWVLHPAAAGETLTIDPPGIVLPLAAVYEGVDFNPKVPGGGG